MCLRKLNLLQSLTKSTFNLRFLPIWSKAAIKYPKNSSNESQIKHDDMVSKLLSLEKNLDKVESKIDMIKDNLMSKIEQSDMLVSKKRDPAKSYKGVG